MDNFVETIADADLRALESMCGYQWQKEEYDAAKPTFSIDVSYRINTIMGPRAMIWHILLKGATPIFTAEQTDIDFLHLDKTPIPTQWTRGHLINKISDSLDEFVDKYKLSRGRSYVPETVELEGFALKPGEIWVVKPNGSGAESGVAVQIVTTEGELKFAREFIAARPQWRGIACRYIARPLLFKGYKFHIRGYIAVRSWAGAIAMPIGGIRLAAEPYRDGVYTNCDVHISHYSSNPTTAIFPDDMLGLPNSAVLVAGYRKIMNDICRELPRATPPPGCSAAYEIIAPDIMFDEDGRAWLLEINRSNTTSIDSSGKATWDKQFVQWEFANCVEAILSRRRHRYWLFSGVGADYTHMKKLMGIAGLEPYPDTEHTKGGELIYTSERIKPIMPFFLHSLSNVPESKKKGFDHNTYTMQGQIQNMLDLGLCPIDDKKYLHELPQMQGWIAATTTLDKYTWNGKPAIARPSGMIFSTGIGIKYIASGEDLADARKYYHSLIEKEKKAGRECSILISEYFTPLHLFHGKKYHLRAYLIVSGYSAAVEVVKISHFGKLIPAKLPFKAGDYNNLDIHDTHLGSDPEDYYFPQHFEEQDKVADIVAQFDKLAGSFTSVVSSLRTYSNFAYGYALYGLDLIVLSDFSVRLIEVNSRVGVACKILNDNSARFFEELSEFEFTYGIKPGL